MIDLVREAGHHVGRGRGIERQRGVEPGGAHGLEGIVHVRRGLPVHDQSVRAGCRELVDAPLRALDHEVHVENALARVDQIPERVDDQRSDRYGRDEVAVHHVHVDHAGAGVHHLLDLRAEAGEVGGENRGCHPDVL